MEPDDVVYRKSVRNMGAILATMVIVVFAALFVPYYLFPQYNVYQSSATLDSPYGFTMHLAVNTTAVHPPTTALLIGWMNSTSSAIENISAAQSWAVPPAKLWGKACTPGWPIGVGVMRGHYTQDNYTLGTLLPPPQPLTIQCPSLTGAPPYFLLEPHSSMALIVVSGNPAIWNLVSTFPLVAPSPTFKPVPGTYTAVLADEWGDVLTFNFVAS